MDGSSLADEPLHGDNREDEFFPDIRGRDPARSILEAASWRLTAELVRRYPDRFSVIETHPGGGQYDCITLLDEDKNSNLSTIDLNRAGSIWVHRRDHSCWTWRDCWQELVTVPRSTRSVVAYRLIALSSLTRSSAGHAGNA